jgi:hypothetical protein
MRFAGFALLFLGFLLCVSIEWAAIGFLAMGFGLICLLIVDERQKLSKIRIDKIAAQPVPSEPVGLLDPATSTESADHQRSNLLKKDRWKSLVESDPDLARVATILSRYGPKYVDQLARVYVVFDNKAFLPIILNMIITSANQNAKTSFTNNNESAPSVESGISRIPVDMGPVNGVRPTDLQMSSLRPTEETSNGLHGSEGSLQPVPIPVDIMEALSNDGGVSQDVAPTSRTAVDADEARALKNLFDRLSLSQR